MNADPQPWDEVYKREGRVFDEPFLGFDDLVATFKKESCQTILDLGCGSGRHLVHLSKSGFRVTGLDNSFTGLKLACEWLSEECRSAQIVQGDMRTSLPFQSNAFDGLMSTQVIHHAVLVTVRGIIREIGRVVREGGIAFVTVPARTDQADDFVEIEPGTFVPLSGWEKGLPHHIFNPDQFAKEFNEFEVLDLSIRGDREVIAILAKRR
jgi:SAM-dependent methyltransferase